MFARGNRKGWKVWGNQSEEYKPSWPTYVYNSQLSRKLPELQLLEKRSMYKRKKVSSK